jgi:amyloid beta precursor protein binding protein 1
LRLVNPINGLVEMAATEQFQDLSKLDSQQHGHVPYPILLYKAMQQWKSQNDGRKLPKTFAEKQDFVALLKSMSRDLNNELNFQEAVTNAYLAYTEREVIFPIDEKMDVDDNDDNNNGSRAAGATSTTLRELFDALRTFMDRHNGRPPLNGSLPDMTSSTEWYVQLQRIYKAQADADVEEMKALLHGASSTITDESIASFCANVFAVSHIATRSLAAEYAGIVDPTANEDEQELVDDWKMSLMDPYEDGPIHTPIVWYLGIRACQTFYEQHGYYPGCNPDTTSTDSWKDDVPILAKVFIDDIVPRYSLTDQEVLTDTESIQKVCHELTRYSNAEIHNVASVVGGVASQEAVKIITGQYIPLNNTYIYNGIVSVGGVYKM